MAREIINYASHDYLNIIFFKDVTDFIHFDSGMIKAILKINNQLKQVSSQLASPKYIVC